MVSQHSSLRMVLKIEDEKGDTTWSFGDNDGEAHLDNVQMEIDNSGQHLKKPIKNCNNTQNKF